MECDGCRKVQATKGTKITFLKAVSVWIIKPHVANRRLCGSTIGRIFRCQSKDETKQVIENMRQQLKVDSYKESWQTDALFKDLAQESSSYTVIIRELVPKSEFFPKLFEAIVFDREESSVTFSPLHQSKGENVKKTQEIEYCVKFQERALNISDDKSTSSEVVLTWVCADTASHESQAQTSALWLCSVLLKKLVDWSEVEDISTEITSLQLVPVDKYQETYVRLKNEYGRDLVKNWTESTDPEKFVYEDVAIATYLLLIWKEDRIKKGLTRKQSFVDLGCGNGLLVYILSKEGHKGLGIDLRRRKIWDTFGPGVDLVEKAISPSCENLFPEFDWLVGNHSDELTPWIPVIAARSCYTCSFFVLPCCHHDFVGKFADCQKGQSRYGTYVDYIQTVVKECGFQAEMDTLRIPSTKRICLIGRERTYDINQEHEADARRQAFIDKRTALASCKISAQESEGNDIEGQEADELQSARSDINHTVRDVQSSRSDCSLSPKNVAGNNNISWAQGFQPRVETASKNCQAVAEETKKKIVHAVFEQVLNAAEGKRVKLSGGRVWRKGGSVSLSEVVAMFDPTTLRELKSNCGGLQTLLRNHSHVFQVSDKQVQLRDFSSADPWKGCNPNKRRRGKGKGTGLVRDTHKTTLCWFAQHHPDGCPRDRETCSFAHDLSELRPKASPSSTSSTVLVQDLHVVK